MIDSNGRARPGVEYLLRKLTPFNPKYTLATLSLRSRVDALDLDNVLKIPFDKIYSREDFVASKTVSGGYSKGIFDSEFNGETFIVDDNVDVWRHKDYPESCYKFIYCPPFEPNHKKDTELFQITDYLVEYLNSRNCD